MICEVIDWGDADPSKEGNYQQEDESQKVVGSNPFAGKEIVSTEISLDWNMCAMYAGRWAFLYSPLLPIFQSVVRT